MTLRSQTSKKEEVQDGPSMPDIPTTSKRALDIRVITHNIRYATKSPFKGEEPWLIRRPRLCSQLVFNSRLPETFICLQEVLHVQLVDILTSLNASSQSGTEWDCIGVGRDDGKEAGEYSPIFYRPAIWELRSWETRWLSPSPHVPGKGWDAGSIRLVTIGEFLHLETSRKIIVMSTHFDNQGSTSREESAKLILRTIEELSKALNPSTILLAGDFNSPPEDGAYQIMTSKDSTMEDIAMRIPLEKRYGNEMTWTSFGYVDNTPDRIDFIFSRKGDAVRYKTFGVLANRFDDGVYLSDHRACVTDVQLSNY